MATGRPQKKLDRTQLAKIMELRPTLDQTAAIFGVSQDTIERRIREWDSLSFAEFRDKNMNHTRIKLSQKALDLALAGNTTMLIFCLKNFCGWSDKYKNNESHDTSLEWVYESSLV